LKSAGAGNGVK